MEILGSPPGDRAGGHFPVRLPDPSRRRGGGGRFGRWRAGGTGPSARHPSEREGPMAVEITGSYTGDLKMELPHGPSGMPLTTAAPRDNMGDGSSFSPTDLLAASLGSCMVTTMAVVARRNGIPFEHASFSLEKQMRADPRRVDAVPVTIRLPASLDPEQ